MKQVIEDTKSISVGDILPPPPASSSDTRQYARFGTDVIYVATEATKPYYGGRRVWLVCPICHRRATRLYVLEDIFACRQCHDLEYGCRAYGRSTAVQEHLSYQKARQIILTRRLTYAGQPTRMGRRLQRVAKSEIVVGIITELFSQPANSP